MKGVMGDFDLVSLTETALLDVYSREYKSQAEKDQEKA